MNTNRELIRRNLTIRFHHELEERIDRQIESIQHGIIPDHHFSSPSHECIEVYRDGHYFSSVSLSHALVDGITRFVLSRNKLKPGNNVENRILRLRKGGLITDVCSEAMSRIWGAKRNDFHHMNSAVITDPNTLKKMAKGNIADLAIIEGELFSCSINEGRVNVKKPLYWDANPDGMIRVYLKLD